MDLDLGADAYLTIDRHPVLLPPIVVSDLFGIHPYTAYAWSQYAQNSWPEYLEAARGRALLG